MAVDPYVSPNQYVVAGHTGADGENTTDAPSGKVVKGQLVPGGVDSKKPNASPAPAKTETKPDSGATKTEATEAPKPASK